ncbi:MAG: HD domain-containing protein [Actinobacteria bacterium]|nr:HD domain-containing protein [Actinomycetota bacterium]
MKELYVNDLKAGMKVKSVFAVSRKTVRKTKSGEDYCTICLQDRSGCIDAVIWPKASVNFNIFEEGDLAEISGDVSDYKGTRQIEVSGIRTLEKDGRADYSDFIRITKKNVEDMFSEMMTFIESVKNKPLKKLLKLFFEDKKFSESFRSSSAAVQYHHAFMGGLLEHTLSVVKICDFLAGSYEKLNRDLLLAGAVLHDIGKIREYEFDEKNITIGVSNEGKLLGHITIGYGMVLEKIKYIKGFPEDLKERLLHIILSHHGAKEFGSPKRPKILEAFVVYHVDHMDADVGGFCIVAEESGGRAEWSGYLKNFERSIYLKELNLQQDFDEYFIDADPDEVEDIDDKNLFAKKQTELNQDELF